MIEHPPPTPATIRYLYGISTGCAFPDCPEPLYRMVDGLPRRVLNSTLAHIHARREGGPRWDASMSADENRAPENLVLLCRFHSATIDDLEDHYSADELRSWKERAESPGSGVELSDDEVRAIGEVWISQPFHLQADTITLGGTLGGGGGAIGAGAFGGRGGDIGQFPELRPAPRVAALCGQADLGKGHIAGFDGQPGGPTAIWRENGEVLVAAGGGGGGFVGSGMRSTDDRLRVSSLLFANALDVRDGLVFALGGAWQHWTVGALPESVRLMVLVVIEAGNVAPGEYTIHVDLHDPAGTRVSRATFPVVVEEAGAVIRLPQVVALEAVWENPGRHALTVSSEVGELASVEVVVRPPQGDGDAEGTTPSTPERLGDLS